MAKPTEQQYTKAWDSWIEELEMLALHADIPYTEYARIRNDLRKLLERAIKNRYPNAYIEG